VKSVVAACPYLDLKPRPEMREKVLAKVMKDRESRLAGKKPTGLAMLTKAGTNPVLRLRLNAEELQLVATEERMVARFQVAVTVETY